MAPDSAASINKLNLQPAAHLMMASHPPSPKQFSRDPRFPVLPRLPPKEPMTQVQTEANMMLPLMHSVSGV